ncbi:MAG: Ig-like domain-containing protein [Ruminococcus sp.]
MKTFKKSMAIILSILMLFSVMTVAGISASAVDEDNTTETSVSEATEASSETEATEASSETEATEASSETEPTEPPTQMEPRSAFYVVGSVELFGTSWGDTPHDPANSMELKDDGIYYLTLENVAAGNYAFKVIDTIKGSITWHPDGMGNDGTVTVAEDGSSVTFAYKPGELAGIVAVNEVPTYPTPTTAPTEPETEPVTTQPVVVEGKATVTVSSNVDKTTATNTYDLSRDKTFTVKYDLKTAAKLLNGQGTLTYDGKSLELVSFTMPNIANAVINTELVNKVAFNFTDCQNLYDFTTAKTFIEATFEFKSATTTAVNLTMEELNGNGANGDVAYVTDGAVVSTFSMAAKASTPTPAPTAAPKLNYTKVTKKAGQSFTLSVKNQPKGTKLSFSSSKKSVAVVSSSGKVSALTKGSATISVKIKNGSKTLKTLTCKVTVSINPKINPAKTLTVKEGKKATIKITGKAKAVKNVYKVKNKKIAKVTSKTTAEKVTVKGLKKGSTTLTLKVNNKSFKVKVKVK